MGLIRSIAPKSIQCLDDMVRALHLVIDDVFHDVGSLQGRRGNALEFLVDDIEGEYEENCFRIVVVPYEEHVLAQQGEGKQFRVTDVERGIIEHIRSEGLTEKQVFMRLGCEPADPRAEEEDENDDEGEPEPGPAPFTEPEQSYLLSAVREVGFTEAIDCLQRLASEQGILDGKSELEDDSSDAA